MAMFLSSGKAGIKHLLLFIAGTLLLVKSGAQDIHFSQYFNNPIAINPSLAGEDAGRGRFILNYRSQWNSITENPYKTSAVSFDRSIIREELFGAVQIFHDKAGDAEMGTTQINLALAPKIWISQTDFLKVGFIGTWSQRFLNTTNLTWNSQFDGTTINPSINSGEEIYRGSVNYFDLSAGILWGHLVTKNNKVNAGISAYHVVRPSHRLASSTENTSIRWVGHADLSWIVVPSKVTIHPSGVFMVQGPARELELGATIKFSTGLNSKYTGYYKAPKLHFGTFYRYNNAFILYTGFEYRNLLQINLSYDFNVSKFVAVAGSRGGMEISMIYTIPKKNIIQLR